MDSKQQGAESLARVREKMEQAVPNATARAAALGLLAHAIENADEERGDAWYLRETRRSLALVAGRIYACSVRPGRVALGVMGPLPDETLAALGIGEEDVLPLKYISGGCWVTLPAERAALALDHLTDHLDRFIDEAMARVRRSVSLDYHAPSAVDYVAEAVGRDLPQPSGPLEPADTDEDDDVGQDEDAAIPRQPKVRGRTPIFEHGQRAVASLIDDIDPDRGAIALPDLQRPFVWEDTKVRDLLDSLFIGYPVGTLVLWHTADERDARALGTSRRGLRATTLVIDGQQRLTSLYAVLRGSEVQDRDGRTRRIEIAFRPRDGRFEVADAAIRRNPEFVPNVTELWSGPRSLYQIQRDMLQALRDRGREIGEAYEEAVAVNLQRAQGIGNYRFPIVDIRRTDAGGDVTEEDVADIFVRINNQGTRLGQAEFVLTLLSVFHGELRDRIEIRARQMSDNSVVSLDPQQVLRMACAVAFGRARMPAIYRYLRGIDAVTGDADTARRGERLDTLDEAAGACVDQTTWRDFMLRVTHAGFVGSGLVASTSAIVNAYAFYVLGRRAGAPRQRLDEAVSRWLFGTLLTARYSSSSEARFEEDLARVRDRGAGDADAFVEALDGVLADSITGDYWVQAVPAALETQRGRAPAALAFRAAQVVLGARALFSDQLLQNLLDPPGRGGRAASEMHHLFPKAWLQEHGIRDRRRINQVANLADVGWHHNSMAGSDGPGKYVLRLRDRLDIQDDRWGRMLAEHALPPGWESMDYLPFLDERRLRMAEIVRIAFRKLGGEAEMPPVTPPWFLPGAETVWQRIGDAERALRGLVRDVYLARFGSEAGVHLEGMLGAREREALGRARRSTPTASDALALVDYLYLGQLPALLFKSEVWSETQRRTGDTRDLKQRLTSVVDKIAPVRNEIAHVREVSPDRLQRANVACLDLLAMVARSSG